MTFRCRGGVLLQHITWNSVARSRGVGCGELYANACCAARQHDTVGGRAPAWARHVAVWHDLGCSPHVEALVHELPFTSSTNMRGVCASSNDGRWLAVLTTCYVAW